MESILVEAEHIVNGPGTAERKYGPPEKVFAVYADIFNSINPNGRHLGALDISYVMLAVKLGRELNSNKRDNLVDACGYLEIISKIRSTV